MPRRAYTPAMLLLSLLAILALPARAAVPAATARVGPGDVYLALGDSLVVGVEAVDDGQPGYPPLFHAELIKLKPAIAIENKGVPGETSSSIRVTGGQLDQAVTFIRAQRAAGKVVSPVTLSIGGNDAAAVIQPGSTTTLTAALTLYRANLEVILDTLVTELSEGGVRTGDLIIQTYYNPYPGMAAIPLFAAFLNGVDPDTDLPKFNQVIAEEAAERRVTVADTYTPFLGNEPLYIFVQRPYVTEQSILLDPVLRAIAFDFHPRPVGHQALAGAFLKASQYNQSFVYLPMVVR